MDNVGHVTYMGKQETYTQFLLVTIMRRSHLRDIDIQRRIMSNGVL